MNTNELYMGRCLQIAAFARGNTSPNPMVGAIIVHNDRIISEGYHHKAGEPHAEPNAINAVKDKSILKECTLFVTLEPCSHYGKTPPCAQLIINYEIPRVVVGMLDPNPQVSGKGIELMREAGIEVTVGVLEKECRDLNKRFLTYFEKHRPYIILKWAQTADGFIDNCRTEGSPHKPLRISNEVTKTLNHQIRTQEDAILVGTSTALLDDPHLTSRKWGTKNPIRCVIDLNGRLPLNLKLWNNEAKTLIFCYSEQHPTNQLKENKHLKVIQIEKGKSLAKQILQGLYNENIQSIIIEGGSITLNTFINEELWDEARVETSNAIIKDGVKTATIQLPPSITEKIYDNQITITFNFDIK